MKDLKAVGEKISPLLYKHEAEFVAAGYSQKLAQLPEELALKTITSLVNRAYMEMEKSPSGLNALERKRNLDTFTRLIRSDLLLYFPEVTVKELEIAIRKGIRREYGEYYTFSTVTIHGFVEKYLESDERTTAIAKQHRFLLMQQVPEEPTLPDQWEIMKQGLFSCYETYCKTGRIIDCGSVNYEFLVKAKEIVLSNEEKRFIYSVAEMQVRSEQQSQAITNRLTYRMLQQMKDDKGPVISRSKEIALKNYFDTRPDFNSMMDKLYKTFHNEVTCQK